VNRCDCRGLLINKTIKSHQTEQNSVEHLNVEAPQRLWQDFFRSDIQAEARFQLLNDCKNSSF
jgi:hypothetical protein